MNLPNSEERFLLRSGNYFFQGMTNGRAKFSASKDTAAKYSYDEAGRVGRELAKVGRAIEIERAP